MKQLAILLILVATVWGATRVRRAIFNDINLKMVPGIMKNPAAVGNHVKCMLAHQDDSSEICDRIGRNLRKQFPRFVEIGRCPDDCTTEENKTAAHIVRVLSTKYPYHWEKIVNYYEITPEIMEQLEEWMTSQGE